MKTPFFSTWRGQLLSAAFAGYALWDFRRLDRFSPSTSDTMRPFLLHITLAAVALYLAYRLFRRRPSLG